MVSFFVSVAIAAVGVQTTRQSAHCDGKLYFLSLFLTPVSPSQSDMFQSIYYALRDNK